MGEEKKKIIKSQCPLETMQARTGWLWGERTTKIIHKSKLQSVAGVATKLLGRGKGYFLSVWRENKQNAAVFHLTQWIIVVTWRRKKPFAGRNEEYPIENSRANTQQGQKKKSGYAKSPRQKTPGKKKDPESSLAHALASQVERESVKTGRVSELPPQRGMGKRGWDQAPMGSCSRQGFGSLSRQVLRRERGVFLFHSGFCLFLNTNSISQCLYSCLHSLAAVNTPSLPWYLWIHKTSVQQKLPQPQGVWFVQFVLGNLSGFSQVLYRVSFIDSCLCSSNSSLLLICPRGSAP